MKRSARMSALIAALLMVAAPAVSHAMVVSRSSRFDLWDWVTRALRALGIG